MKCSRSSVQRKAHATPDLRFEQQRLTSFSGLFLLQLLLGRLLFKERLRRCFDHLGKEAIYGLPRIVLQLIVHLFLGFRELRDSRYYSDDPMVHRLLGQERIPDVSTVSRALKTADEKSVTNLRQLLRSLVLDRVETLGLRRITLDFDGSVLSTSRKAEGTAVGFNRKKKGARSYYPLFCTLSQTGQVFDVLHRPGNSHDSRGARDFMEHCIGEIRSRLPETILEVRIDAAFFSDEIVTTLKDLGVEFTLSVPFERFPELKATIQKRRRWHRAGRGLWFFPVAWKPKVWKGNHRFLVIRTVTKAEHKGPLQLDLFRPIETGYEFKVILTNKTLQARSLAAFHEGRGGQERVFGELKSLSHATYIPFRRWIANQIYLLCSLLAHNLSRELQMVLAQPHRRTTARRSPLWTFLRPDTLRRNFISRAGRLTRPAGKLTLTISANRRVQEELLDMREALLRAA